MRGGRKSRHTRAEAAFWVNPLGEGAIEGIIVARSKGYLDVSVKAFGCTRNQARQDLPIRHGDQSGEL